MCGEPAGGAAGDVLAELVAVEPDLAGVVVAVDTEQRENVVLGGEALHEEQSGSGVEADGHGVLLLFGDGEQGRGLGDEGGRGAVGTPVDGVDGDVAPIPPR